MKISVILFAVVIMLGGCQSLNYQSQGHSKSARDISTDRPSNPKILPAPALSALKNINVDPAFVVVMGTDKNIYLLKRNEGDGFTTFETLFPVNWTVTSVMSSTAVFHGKNSCVTYEWGGTSYTTCW